MANELWPAQILLLSSAVPVAIEAYKAKPPGFYVLWFITASMILAGLLAPALVNEETGQRLYGLAINPFTWFVLAVALFFVVRPYWQKAPTAEARPDVPPRDCAPDVQPDAIPPALTRRVQVIEVEVERHRQKLFEEPPQPPEPSRVEKAFEAARRYPSFLAKVNQLPPLPEPKAFEAPGSRPMANWAADLFVYATNVGSFMGNRGMFTDVILAARTRAKEGTAFYEMTDADVERFGHLARKREWLTLSMSRAALEGALNSKLRELRDDAGPFIREGEGIERKRGK